MTTWLPLLGALLTFVTAVTRYFAKKERDDGVRAQMILEGLENANAIVRTATRARDAQRDADARDPDRMRNDVDPNRRD